MEQLDIALKRLSDDLDASLEAIRAELVNGEPHDVEELALAHQRIARAAGVVEGLLTGLAISKAQGGA